MIRLSYKGEEEKEEEANEGIIDFSKLLSSKDYEDQMN